MGAEKICADKRNIGKISKCAARLNSREKGVRKNPRVFFFALGSLKVPLLVFFLTLTSEVINFNGALIINVTKSPIAIITDTID